MQRFWKEFPVEDFFLWLASFASIGGFFLTVNDHPWWGCVFIASLSATAIRFCCRANSAKVRAIAAKDIAEVARSDAEKRQREAEERLNNAATEFVKGIKDVVERQSLARALSTIGWLCDYVTRMAALGKKSSYFEVITPTVMGNMLYLITRVPEDVVAFLRIGDAFDLVALGANRVEHYIARVKVHQIQGSLKKDVAFAVADAVDQEAVEALRSSGLTGQIKMRSGYRVQVPDVTDFKDMNGDVVIAAMKIIESQLLEDSKGEQTWKL